MINLSRVVTSLGLNAQRLTITRTTGSFGKGGWVVEDTCTMQVLGVAYPSSSREILHVPEGDRVVGSITFLTKEPLFVTHNTQNQGISDRITWKGEQYEIHYVFPFSDYGYYMSVGNRLTGD